MLFNETEDTEADLVNQQMGRTDGDCPEAVFPPANAQSELADILEQKQIKYLKGRKATKAIKDKSGNDIILEGEIISGDIINMAREKGRLIDLIMNNEA